MSHILLTDTASNGKLYKLADFSSVILDSFSTPSTSPYGSCWDGTDLYTTDLASYKVYKHSGLTSTISDSFSSPSTAPYGVDIYGGNIYLVDKTKILKLSGFSKTISDSFSSPSTAPRGLKFMGSDLLSNDSNVSSYKVWKHNGFSATITSSFSGIWGTDDCDIGSDGTNVYLVSSIYDKLFKMSGFSSTISNSFSAPASSSAVRGVSYRLFTTIEVGVFDTITINDSDETCRIAYGTDYYAENSPFTVSLDNGTSVKPLQIMYSGDQYLQALRINNGNLIFNKNYRICKANGISTSSINTSFSAPHSFMGAAYDGTNVFSIEYDYNDGYYKLYKHVGFTATISTSFSSPSNRIDDIWYGNGHIYFYDGFTAQKIFRYQPDNFTTAYDWSLSWPSSSSRESFDMFEGNFIARTNTKIFRYQGTTATLTACYSGPAYVQYEMGLTMWREKGVTKPVKLIFDQPANSLWIDTYDYISLYTTAAVGRSIIDLSAYESLSVADYDFGRRVRLCSDNSIVDVFSDVTNMVDASMRLSLSPKYTYAITSYQTAGGTHQLVGQGSNGIYRFVGFTTTVSDSFSAPVSDYMGLNVDSNRNLYFLGSSDGKIWKMNGFSATISSSVSGYPTYTLYGLDFDESNNPVVTFNSSKLVVYSGFSTTISTSTSSFGYTGTPYSIQYGAKYGESPAYLTTLTSKQRICRTLGFTTTLVSSFSSPSDGFYLGTALAVTYRETATRPNFEYIYSVALELVWDNASIVDAMSLLVSPNAFIYDSVTLSEMDSVARIGLIGLYVVEQRGISIVPRTVGPYGPM